MLFKVANLKLMVMPEHNKFKSKSQRVGYYSGRHNFPKIEEPKPKIKKTNPVKREDKKLKYLEKKIARQASRQKAIQEQQKHVQRENAILQQLYAGKIRPENVSDVREGGTVKGTVRLDPRFGGN